jgi:putative nucleotidyltransferase with HDIG domain
MQARLHRARYRTWQFVRALGERPDGETYALASRLLDARGKALFMSLSERDQRHSARTAALMVEWGVGDPDLLLAGILHDVGKERQHLWQRVAFVLLAAGPPGVLRRLARPGHGWRGALWRACRHSKLGADKVRAAGYSERVARIIQHHHDKDSTGDLALLQSADERA